MSRATRSCDPVALEVAAQLGEHLGRRDVDERDGLGVEHDGAHAVGARVARGSSAGRARRWRRTARPRRAGRRRRAASAASLARDVDPVAVGQAPEHGHVGPRGAVEQQQQRHRDADEQPGQRVEDQHAEQRGERGDEVGPRGAGRRSGPAGSSRRGTAARAPGCRPARSRRRSRPRPASPRAGSRTGPVRNSSVTTVSSGDDEPGDLALRAGAAVDRGLREAAVDHHAAGQPGAEVGRAEADSSRFGVDVVVVARRVGLGGAEALGEADQRDADGARREVEVVRGRARRAARPAAARCRSSRRCRRRSGSSSSTTRTPTATATSEPGTTGAKRRSPSTSASDSSADGQRGGRRVSPRLAEQAPDLLEEVALALLDAEQLRELADDDGQREADDEALEHRLGDEAGEEAEPQQARRRARRCPVTMASAAVSVT